MNDNIPYRAILTREQFLFYEMRIIAELICENKSEDEILQEVYECNLFQFPTERMVKNITKVCLKRLYAMDNHQLIEMVAYESSSVSKQVCLYSMMNYYRVIYEFMTTVIAEKYRTKDFSFSKRDVSVFFSHLQEQHDDVALWKEATIKKLTQVIIKILVENQYLDSTKSEILNPVLIDFQLKNILLERKEYECLAAFNCFDEV